MSDEFFVGQKLYALNDNSPGWRTEDKVRHRGKPWYTFESCKILKINPKTLKIRFGEAKYVSDYSLKWSRTARLPIDEVGGVWCLTKKELIEEELKSRVRDLNNSKETVSEKQKFVSRLKRMAREHSRR